MDLFEQNSNEQLSREGPLAYRMRPKTFEEFFGQEHIVGEGRLLRRAIEADQLSSIILFGPPGTGKTTLAHLISQYTSSVFVTLSAVLAGVKELREVIARAKDNRGMYQKRTVLFVDEIHRWNKTQQDALLPHVETGEIILIGATTENPYFEVVGPLLSRSRVFELKKLTEDDMRRVVAQALADPERGYGQMPVSISAEAMEHLIRMADGDARTILNAVELAVATTQPDQEGVISIDLATAQESIQKRAVRYDSGADEHYDTISAFIKSVRGSDADAALFWLGKMLVAGEDPRFILRRLFILSGEDIGMANPHAMMMISACADAFEWVGLPEGYYFLAVGTLYLATAPKSNSAGAIFKVMDDIKAGIDLTVPIHLRNKGGGEHVDTPGYLYPHSFPGHWVRQQYLPEDAMRGGWYQPSDQGYEQKIGDWWAEIKSRLGRA